MDYSIFYNDLHSKDLQVLMGILSKREKIEIRKCGSGFQKSRIIKKRRGKHSNGKEVSWNVLYSSMKFKNKNCKDVRF